MEEFGRYTHSFAPKLVLVVVETGWTDGPGRHLPCQAERLAEQRSCLEFRLREWKIQLKRNGKPNSIGD